MNGYPSFYPRIALVAPSPGIDEAAIMEQYGNEADLAALEWLDIFDSDYRLWSAKGDKTP